MFATLVAGIAKGITDTPWLILIGGFNGPFLKCGGERDNNVSFSTE